MRKTGKIFGAVMAAIMILTSFSMMVMADEQPIASGSDWKFYANNELKITREYSDIYMRDFPEYYVNKAEKITIDFTGTDYGWVSIHGDNCKAKSVVVTGSNIKKMRSLSFYDFPDITENNISLPAGKDILYLTFESVGIKTIDFLNSVQVTEVTITGCNNLQKVVLSNDVDTLYVSKCPKLSNLTTTNALKTLSIYNSPELKNVNLPSGLTKLSWSGYPNSEITVPISPSVVLRSDKLEKATIESGKTKINSMMFRDCINLKSVKIPDTVSSIEYKAFFNCYNLRTLDIPSSVKIIGEQAFCYSGLQKVSIPKNLIYFDVTAFAGCSSLTDVYLEASEAEFKQSIGQYLDPTDFFGNATIHYNATMPGWKNDNGTWRYYDDEGKKATGWKQINEIWYFFDDNGAMFTGWKKSGNDWYYLDPATGAMVTGWKQISGKWYHFDPFGKMGSNAAYLIDGKTYVFNSSGEMVNSGWYKYVSSTGKTTWYYCNSDGTAAIGWKKIDGKWYYFLQTGSMAENIMIEDNGKKYFIGSDGLMVTGWKQLGSDWYFFKADGSMATKEYCNGYWLDSDGKWTYQYVAKWTKDSKGWWYGDSTGWYAKNQSITIDGKVYNFNASGYCTNP